MWSVVRIGVVKTSAENDMDHIHPVDCQSSVALACPIRVAGIRSNLCRCCRGKTAANIIDVENFGEIRIEYRRAAGCQRVHHEVNIVIGVEGYPRRLIAIGRIGCGQVRRGLKRATTCYWYRKRGSRYWIID